MVSKSNVRLVKNQMIPFVQNVLSSSTQHAPLILVESCKNSIDNGGVPGGIPTDVSKTFDRLKHELLITKLNADGLSRSVLLLIYCYLTGRKQRVKANGTFSAKGEVFPGFPQRSVLGSLLSISILMVFLCSLRKQRSAIFQMMQKQEMSLNF